MSKIADIKAEIILVGKGIEYIDKPNLTQKQVDDFLPKLGEKMKKLSAMAAELEKETGRKLDWDNPDYIYDLGEQLSFDKKK